MKYVIDIPTEYYEAIKKIPFETYTADMLIIANGKPLDNVLDEIKAEIDQDAFKDVNGSKFTFVNRVNQIIDKYKAESSETEQGLAHADQEAMMPAT